MCVVVESWRCCGLVSLVSDIVDLVVSCCGAGLVFVAIATVVDVLVKVQDQHVLQRCTPHTLSVVVVFF